MKFYTGADATCIPAIYLNITFAEKDFTKWIQSNDNIELIEAGHITKQHLIAKNHVGIDRNSDPIKSYLIQLDEFVVASDNINPINLGSVPVFITFDNRFRTPLLGRDLISLLNISVDNDRNILEIDKSKKYYHYIDKYDKIPPQYLIDIGLINEDTALIHEYSNED